MPDAFYKTKQWAAVRDRVKANWRHQKLPCHYCGEPLDWSRRYGTIVDHVIPRHQRPDLAFTESNLVVVHHQCNSKKAAWSDRSSKVVVGEDGYPEDSGW
jgi:5-methylcytosine-specific restriction endonuclease McrA